MTVTQFLVALALGAGAIALWINNRFPGIAPGRMVIAFVHVGIAMVIGMALVPAIDAFVEASAAAHAGDRDHVRRRVPGARLRVAHLDLGHPHRAGRDAPVSLAQLRTRPSQLYE